MKKFKKIGKYFLYAFLVFFILISFFLNMGINNTSDVKFGFNLIIKEYPSYNFSYVKTNYGHSNSIIFIHGTPGSWQGFEGYLLDERLSKKYEMYSVNRLGFKESQVADSKFETNYEIQIEPIIDIIEEIKANDPDSKIILVGHSLGASILKGAYNLSYENIDALVPIAGHMDHTLAKKRWYNYLTNNFIGNFIIGRDLMIANKEVAAGHDELLKFAGTWENAKVPIIYIQAENDMITNPESLNFMDSIKNSNLKIIRYTDGNHFIVWGNQTQIVDEILSLDLK